MDTLVRAPQTSQVDRPQGPQASEATVPRKAKFPANGPSNRIVVLPVKMAWHQIWRQVEIRNSINFIKGDQCRQQVKAKKSAGLKVRSRVEVLLSLVL